MMKWFDLRQNARLLRELMADRSVLVKYGTRRRRYSLRSLEEIDAAIVNLRLERRDLHD